MATDQFSIIRNAASRTGNGNITSLEDNDDVAELTKQHYESIVEQMLTQHAWKFARRVGALTQLALIPERPWSALYQTPTDCLSLQYVQTQAALRIDHEERDTPSGRAIAVLLPFGPPPVAGVTTFVPDPATAGATALTPALLAVYTARVAEDRWPADFAMAVQHRMEAIFYGAISEDQGAADEREALAEKREQKARVRDQRASTPTDPNEWDLTRARRRGDAWGAFRERGRGYV